MSAVPTPPSGGIKALAYIGSFFIPLVGIILFFVWRSNPLPEYQALGKTCGIIAVAVIALVCVCNLIATFAGVGLSGLN